MKRNGLRSRLCEKFGPQYADYVRWYCEIFRRC
jgi:hypothetical protein